MGVETAPFKLVGFIFLTWGAVRITDSSSRAGLDKANNKIARLQSENERLHLSAISSERLATEMGKARDEFARGLARMEKENAECKRRLAGLRTRGHTVQRSGDFEYR